MTLPTNDRLGDKKLTTQLGHDALQAKNRAWWEENPMTYDWLRTLRVEPGTPEFYQVIDQRFSEAHRPFGHPDYPAEPLFGRQIDYAGLRGKRVLEIGCGAGAMSASFARAGVLITGIDITQTAVGLTRRRFELEGLQGDIIQMDAEKLEFPDNHFDLVWSWGVIHCSANMQDVVNQIYRVLKPGCQAKIMVYYRHALRNWITAGLEQGILRGKFLTTSYDEILRQVTDGYIARHITREEAQRYFAAFKNLRFELTDMASLSFIPGNVQIDKYLAGRVIPRGFKRRWDDWLMRKFGWFLFIEGEK